MKYTVVLHYDHIMGVNHKCHHVRSHQKLRGYSLNLKRCHFDLTSVAGRTKITISSAASEENPAKGATLLSSGVAVGQPEHRHNQVVCLEMLSGNWFFGTRKHGYLERKILKQTLTRVTLYSAGHLHTAVPHCSHSRAPGEQWARLCVFTLQGCVQAARLCRGSPVINKMWQREHEAYLGLWAPSVVSYYHWLTSNVPTTNSGVKSFITPIESFWVFLTRVP